jgi:hypothetical protein
MVAGGCAVIGRRAEAGHDQRIAALAEDFRDHVAAHQFGLF